MIDAFAKPVARIASLTITESSGEIIAYDPETLALHHLNATSTTIWRLCDGQHTLAALAAETGISLEGVHAHLAELARINLLDGRTWTQTDAGMSRRRMLKRTAVTGAVLAPLVVSVTAPAAAGAASVTCTGACAVGFDCQSNCVCDPVDAMCVPELP